MNSLIAGSFLLCLGLSSPWDKPVNRHAPWQTDSVTKEKKRNSLADYFAGLNDSTVDQARASSKTQLKSAKAAREKSSDVSGSGYSLIVSESSSETELDELPWKTYREKGGRRLEESFLWPVSRAELSSGYGMRSGKVHEGIDLKADKGSLVRATASGRVVLSSWMRGYGRIVVIYHGDGLSSVYAHNQKNLVKAGRWVKQGESIARLGESGKTRGAHLHFELRQDGKAVNPLSFFFRESPLRSSR